MKENLIEILQQRLPRLSNDQGLLTGPEVELLFFFKRWGLKPVSSQILLKISSGINKCYLEMEPKFQLSLYLERLSCKIATEFILYVIMCSDSKRFSE